MIKTLKSAVHALLFVIAVVVFFLGLGLGLQYNPNLGTLLWIAAVAIAGLNLLWMFRPRAKAGQ